MGINARFLEKYNEAYSGLQTIVPAITYDQSSIYYYEEIWLPILGKYVPNVIEGAYEISNYGKIFTHIKSPNYPNGGIMIPSHNSHGYQQINLLSNDHKKIGCKVARLVLLHFRFVENCQYFEVDHIDGNKDNNSIWNLEWVTPQENVHRAIKNNLRPLSCTTEDGTLLTDEQANELYLKSYQDIPYEILAKEYNVSIQYIDGLHTGHIRPYIHGQFYSRRHI